MPSKKTIKKTKSKQVSLPRQFDITKTFLKDWQRLTHSGRYDMKALKTAMMLLIQGEPLPAEYHDHPLQGDWVNYRECHVGGDFLMIYQIKDARVIFVRTGTHSELF